MIGRPPGAALVPCAALVRSSEAVLMPTGGVVIAGVFMTVEAILLPHEGVRVFPYFLANSLVLLQVRLQRRVLLDKFFVVRSEERRVGQEGRSRWSPYH